MCISWHFSLSYFLPLSPPLSLCPPFFSSLSHSISFSLLSSPLSSLIFLVKTSVDHSLPVCLCTESRGRTITCSKCYGTALMDNSILRAALGLAGGQLGSEGDIRSPVTALSRNRACKKHVQYYRQTYVPCKWPEGTR